MIEIEAKDLQNEDLQTGVVLVDIWAPWCGPCRMLAPQLEKLSQEVTKAKFVKVNSDEDSEYATAQGVRSIPTVIILKDGVEVERFVGIKPMSEVTSILEKYID